MNAHANRRWLLVPAGVAVFATLLHTLRQRARQPRLAPMSDEWLRDHAVDRPA